MAIFNIDEIINDPWAGLRDTDAYLNYVMEEVQRLLDCGELITTTLDNFFDMLEGNPVPIYSFKFDGREFGYDYFDNSIIVKCDEIYFMESFNIINGKLSLPKRRRRDLPFYQLMFFECR